MRGSEHASSKPFKTGESLDAARLWQGEARWLARPGGGNEPKDCGAELSFHQSRAWRLANASSKQFQPERRNRPFRMPIYIGAFFPRARGTRVESPGYRF